MDVFEKNPIIIFGDSITALGVIKGIKEMGQIDTYVVSSEGAGIACHSRYIKGKIVIGNNEENYCEKVADFIENNFTTKPILMIAGNDTALEKLSKCHSQLNKFSIPTFPCWGVVNKVINKEITYKAAGELGIPTMETQKVSNKDELIKYLCNSDDYPKFLKSTYSREFSERFKTKGVVCQNRKDAEEAYEKYEGFLDSLLIQPFISGDIDQITAVLLVISPSGNLLSATVNEKVRAPVIYGSTSLSRSIWDAKLVDRAVNLAKYIGYYGVLGVQFKYDSKINDFRVLEINGRFSVSTPLAQRCGHNLPEILYLSIVNENKIKPQLIEQTYPKGIVLWMPINDFRVLLQGRFYKNPARYLCPLIGRGYTIMPFGVMDLGILKNMLSRGLYRIKIKISKGLGGVK